MAVDEQKVEAAVGKVFGELGIGITGPLIAPGYTRLRRVAQGAAPSNIVLEARP